VSTRAPQGEADRVRKALDLAPTYMDMEDLMRRHVDGSALDPWAKKVIGQMRSTLLSIQDAMRLP
jgi:hypothetical protein